MQHWAACGPEAGAGSETDDVLVADGGPGVLFEFPGPANQSSQLNSRAAIVPQISEKFY